MPRPNLAGYWPNFETLDRAITNGHAAIVEALDTRTNRRAVIVVAMQGTDDGQIQMVPLAQLLDGNPYEYLASPDTDSGGYRAPDGSVITQQQADHAESAPADCLTLDRIAHLIADEEWNADMHGRIAALLRANGRDLTPTHEYPEEAQRQQRRAEILAELEAQNGRNARKTTDPEPRAYLALVIDDGETHTAQNAHTKQDAEAHIIEAANDIRDRMSGNTHAEITTYDAAVEYLDTYGAYVRIFEIG